MNEPVVRGAAMDVSALPTVVFGHRSLMWWGTLWIMVIEGTVFGLAVMAYFYLRSHQATWPLTAPPPDLLWGTLNAAIMLASFLPAHMAAHPWIYGPALILATASVSYGYARANRLPAPRMPDQRRQEHRPTKEARPELV